QLLHPFMPFVTEEIYQLLKTQNEDLINKQLPQKTSVNNTIIKNGALLQSIITAVRDTRNKSQLKPKDTISLSVDSKQVEFYNKVKDILQLQLNADTIEM